MPWHRVTHLRLFLAALLLVLATALAILGYREAFRAGGPMPAAAAAFDTVPSAG